MTPGANIIDASLRALEYNQGSPTFIYGGRHYACSFGAQTSDGQLSVGGWESQDEVEMSVRFSAIVPRRLASDEEMFDASSEEPTADANLAPPRKGWVLIGCKNGEYKQWRIERVRTGLGAWYCHLISPDK